MAVYLKGYGGCGYDTSNCATPCGVVCPDISSVEFRSRSASKSKCGFDEFGTPSSPPKKYLVMTQSGARVATVNGNSGFSLMSTYSGAETYTRPNCDYSDTRNLNIFTSYGPDSNNCSGNFNYPNISPNTAGGFSGAEYGCTDFELSSNCGEPYLAIDSCCTGGTIAGTTQLTYYCTPGGYDVASSNVKMELSSEYTTTDLNNDTVAAIVAATFSAWSGTPITGYTIIPADQLSCSIRDVQVRFNFSATPSTGCKLLYTFTEINSGVHFNFCVNLASGATNYVAEMPYGGATGTVDEEYQLTGTPVVVSGAC